MVELIIVEVGDIHSDLVVLIPEILGEMVDRLGGRFGVKLGIQCVPIWLGRGEDTNNILQFGYAILHFKPQKFDNQKFHSFISVISAMYAADIIYVTCIDWLKANSSLCFMDNSHEGAITRRGLRSRWGDSSVTCSGSMRASHNTLVGAAEDDVRGLGIGWDSGRTMDSLI